MTPEQIEKVALSAFRGALKRALEVDDRMPHILIAAAAATLVGFLKEALIFEQISAEEVGDLARDLAAEAIKRAEEEHTSPAVAEAFRLAKEELTREKGHGPNSVSPPMTRVVVSHRRLPSDNYSSTVTTIRIPHELACS